MANKSSKSHSISRKSLKSKRTSPKSKRTSPKKSKRRSISKKSKRTSPKKSKRRSPKKSKKSPQSDYKWMDTSKFKKNSLGKFGYTTHKSMIHRHSALKEAIKEYGAHSVWSKLNAVSILNKNRSPKTSDIFKHDKNWVKRNYLSKD